MVRLDLYNYMYGLILYLKLFYFNVYACHFYIDMIKKFKNRILNLKKNLNEDICAAVQFI